MKKYLYILVESKDREFDAKLLLTYHALLRGYQVIIGDKFTLWKLMLGGHLPKGVVIDKSLQPAITHKLKKLNEKGYKIVSIDEEAVAILEESKFLNARYSQENIDLSSFVFAWGNQHLDMLKRHFVSSEEKFVATGNMRVDILKSSYAPIFSDKASEIKDKFGFFILVPSNFATLNHINGGTVLDVLEQEGVIKNNLDREYYTYWIEYVRKIFENFKILIASLSENFPNINIIFRPHPSDNKAVYDEFCKKFNNVHCIYDGSIQPWITACDLLIHNGCTTGSEAFLSKKPVISYHPIPDEKYTLKNPNNLSLRCESIESVCFQVQHLIENGRLDIKTEQKRKIEDTAEYLFTNYKENEFAFDKTLDLIDQVSFPCKRDVFTSKFRYYTKNKIKEAIRKILIKFNVLFDINQLNKNKFPHTSLLELQERLNILENVENQKLNFNAEILEKNVFLIRS